MDLPSSAHLLSPLARKIIRQEYDDLDPKLNAYLRLLSERGADECWHKHSTFKEHLFGVWRILKLWGQSEAICRLALFHSAYSNDYVNLAIFDRSEERQGLKDMMGDEAEDLVYKFCIIPRHTMIVDTLLGAGSIPEEGLTVKHIIDGSDVHLTSKEIAIYVITTIADFADQWFGWQDHLVENFGAIMNLNHPGDPRILWPGESNPGMWMSYTNRLAKLLLNSKLDQSIVIPPIFDSLRGTVTPEKEVIASKLYRDVCAKKVRPEFIEEAILDLEKSLEANPYFSETYIVLAQLYIHSGEWEKASASVVSGLQSLQTWGTISDKRTSWEAWIAWARVLWQQAQIKAWPTEAATGGRKSMMSLGLVK